MLIFYREQNNLNYPAFVEKKTIIREKQVTMFSHQRKTTISFEN